MIVSVLVDTSSPARSGGQLSSATAGCRARRCGCPCRPAGCRSRRPRRRSPSAGETDVDDAGLERADLAPRDAGARRSRRPVAVRATRRSTRSHSVQQASHRLLARRPPDRVAGARRARLECMTGRIVITGAGGQVGGCLAAQAARRGRDVLALTSSQWDITDPAAARAVHRTRRRGGQLRGLHQRSTPPRANPSGALRRQRHRRRERRARLRARRRRADPHLHRLRVQRRLRRRPRRDPTSIDDATAPLACTAAPSSPASWPCSPRCPTPTSCAPPGSTPAATATTSSPSCAGWPPATAPSMWSTTRSGRPPTSATWPPRCWRSPTAAIREPRAARRQRGRGQPVRAGAGGVRRIGADPERVRPVEQRRHPRPGAAAAVLRAVGRQSAAAGLTPLRPWRDALAAALAGGLPRYPRADRPLPSTRELTNSAVVTVTYSPGPHLDRFLASLSLATERPVTRRAWPTTAPPTEPRGSRRALSQRAAAAHRRPTSATAPRSTAPSPSYRRTCRATTSIWSIVANPDVQWGPGSIDALLDAADRWPRAGALGPLIRDPDGVGLPVGAPPAQPDPRRHARGASGRSGRRNPWTAAYRQERLEPSERPVGWLSGSCLLVRRVGLRPGRRIRRALLHVHGRRRPRRSAGQGGLAERLRAVGGGPARTRATPPAATRPAIWRAHHKSTYIFLADRHSGWWQAPLRWTLRGALAVRSRLVVRSSRRKSRRRLAEGRR